MEIDDRLVIQRVKEALAVRTASLAGETGLSLMGELTAEAKSSLIAIQNVVDDMARQKRLWLANSMNERIADSNAVIESEFSRERWIMIQTIFNNFSTWLNTPVEILPGLSVAPIVVISLRENPPAYTPPPTP